MIKKSDIESNFSDLSELPENVLKFKDVVPAYTYVYYLQINAANNSDLLVVVQDAEDDYFSKLLLKEASSHKCVKSGLAKFPLTCERKYSFTHLLLAPPDFHSYFKGRLDSKRTDLFLAIPIYNCEFNGKETVELFCRIRREIVSTLNWGREPSPLAMVRFDNPQTGGGTTGSTAVPIRYDLLLNEVRNIEGVASAFIEVNNYRGHRLELLSPELENYTIRIQDQPPEHNCLYVDIVEKIRRFLTE